jgi:site-specific recombinase XerD
MSKDNKSEIINTFRQNIINLIDSSVADNVTDELIRILSDYDIEKQCRELVTFDDIDFRTLKRYCACLIVDGKSELTIAQYYRTVSIFLRQIQKHFTEVDSYDIRWFLACEKNRGVSNRTLENTRIQLSAFFQWMVNDDLINKNPCSTVNAIKYTKKVRHPFSSVEIDALRSTCKNSKERAILELLLSSGMRVSELTGLNVNDIDLDNMVIHIRHGKGDKERITYMSDVAKVYLLRYLSERNVQGEKVFYNKKFQPLNNGGVRHILKTLGERAGVEHVHPHRFRRTFATGMASRGMDIQDIKTLLGHVKLDTTLEYIYMDSNKVQISYKQHIV